MSALLALKAAASLTDVATLVGFKPASLSYILYKKGAGQNYKKFEIPKRYGGTRRISAPTPELKLIQRRLADLLQDCSDEINKADDFADSIAHGFKRARSIVTNAKHHRGRHFVFNVDLHDFFGTINFGRVRGFFLKEKHFALNEKVATVLAQIACFENSLPQGSPCSPVISNLIAHVLDVQLVRIAARSGCLYTRYADDLTFSTNARMFPEAIAKCADDNANLWTVGSKVQRALDKCGFTLNPVKTRMQYWRSRQEVTGLTVNRKLNSRREYRQLVRAMVNRLVKKGSFEIIRKVPDGAGGVAIQQQLGKVVQLRGMLAFIESVDSYTRELKREADANKGKKNDTKPSTRELVYRRFLLYADFYAATRPVLIGEGSTDYVYLLHAIRSLAAGYPQLAALGANGSVSLKAKIYRYSPNSMVGRILEVRGGTANLNKLIYTYHVQSKYFSAPGASNPVVVVVDNDRGSGPVYKVIEELTGDKPDRTKPFFHVTRNLYVVPTPLGQGNADSKMEDLFDGAIKSTILAGKSFDDTNNTDSATHYGKTIFAHKVIKPNADTIDFNGFAPLLDRIVLVLNEHAKKVATAAEYGPAQT